MRKLIELGLSEPEADAKTPLYDAAGRALAQMGADAQRWSLWVPGRIEVLGKHTDYAGGRSLVCALERGFCVQVAPRRDSVVRTYSVHNEETYETSLANPLAAVRGHWSNYVATVVTRLARNFDRVLRGADIAFASDLPPDAGMSSSSALVVATFIALSKANDLRSNTAFRSMISSGEELAAYLGAVENGRPFRELAGDVGAGIFGGNQDQTAILCSEPGQLVRYAWDPVRREGLYRLPDDYVFALASSGVHAPKSGIAREKYNRVSLAAQRLVELWNRDTGRSDLMLGSVILNENGAVEHIRALAAKARGGPFTATYLKGRLEQFVAETCEIIPAACEALQRGSVTEFGVVVDHSMRLAETFLENQVPETVTLQRSARELGAVAASAFGAGFGGAVWALVREADADAFLTQWSEGYRKKHRKPGKEAVFFLSRAGPHAYQF
ncbi:MAG TPA: galactokinase family protein [Gemmatimonadaceae bacterium]